MTQPIEILLGSFWYAIADLYNNLVLNRISRGEYSEFCERINRAENFLAERTELNYNTVADLLSIVRHQRNPTVTEYSTLHKTILAGREIVCGVYKDIRYTSAADSFYPHKLQLKGYGRDLDYRLVKALLLQHFLVLYSLGDSGHASIHFHGSDGTARPTKKDLLEAGYLHNQMVHIIDVFSEEYLHVLKHHPPTMPKLGSSIETQVVERLPGYLDVTDFHTVRLPRSRLSHHGLSPRFVDELQQLVSKYGYITMKGNSVVANAGELTIVPSAINRWQCWARKYHKKPNRVIALLKRFGRRYRVLRLAPKSVRKIPEERLSFYKPRKPADMASVYLGNLF
jgi:hypothetical protein